MQQMDFFDHCPLAPDQVMSQLLELKNSLNAVRRGIFQKHQDLKNLVTDLQMKVEELSQHQVQPPQSPAA